MLNVNLLDDLRRLRVRRVIAHERVREVFFFFLIGGTSAVLYTLLNVLFTRTGLRPSASIAFTLIILVPPTYLAQARLTFRSAREHRYAFPRYLGTQLFGNVFALIAAEIIPEAIRAHPVAAYVIMAFAVAVTNYMFLKFWAFRRAPAAA